MIYIVHEVEGGDILAAYKDLQDARCFLNFGEADGTILRGYYTISEVKLK
jgi:hypothetical protein